MAYQQVRQNLQVDAHLKEIAFFLEGGELPHYMKSTKCCESRSREPIHKRKSVLVVPKSPVKVKVQKRTSPKSVSKTPVQRIDTKTMDDYKKIVQCNIKSCKNLLDKHNH